MPIGDNEIIDLFNASKGDNDHHHHGVTLEEVAPSLSIFYRALSNRVISIIPYKNEQDPVQFPDTHTTVRLPRKIDKFHDQSDNKGWYKVALAHRAYHYEVGGTFSFVYHRKARLFESFRPDTKPGRDDGLKTDLEVFFGLFSKTRLAIEIFTALEGMRTDNKLIEVYPGLAEGLYKAKANALRSRVAEFSNPANGVLELMVQMTLKNEWEFEAPLSLADAIRKVGSVVKILSSSIATVEDSAEATIRVYSIVSRTPNYLPSSDEIVPVLLDEVSEEVGFRIKLPEIDPRRLEGDEVRELSLAPVDYRDALGSRYTKYKGAGPLDQEAVYRFTEGEEDDSEPDVVSENYDLLTQPDIPEEPMDHCPHDHLGGDDPEDHIEGELHDHEEASFVYPEWDCYAAAYKKNWCRVRESKLESSASSVYLKETLNEYRNLLPSIHSGLQKVAFEGLKKVHKRSDGEEIDIDSAIESMVDLRMGLTPNDSVYISRERGERDVSVLFAVDKSSSTAEHIVEGLPVKVHGKNYKTLLDIEKESVVLIMNSLERIGDRYAVYFFSGTGREDVKFQTFKDFDESVGDLVVGRIDNIMPLHTTRMGAVIRHAMAKLKSEPSKTKYLFLLSDGRPYDIDYGQEYGDDQEAEYAIGDTRKALLEAKENNIVPFILTVDPNGDDYLKSMCDDFLYESLDDVKKLPEKLFSLYAAVSS